MGGVHVEKRLWGVFCWSELRVTISVEPKRSKTQFQSTIIIKPFPIVTSVLGLLTDDNIYVKIIEMSLLNHIITLFFFYIHVNKYLYFNRTFDYYMSYIN